MSIAVAATGSGARVLPVAAGQPAGVFLIAGTEFWERFSFYSVSVLLALYLVAPTAGGGLGWPIQQALTVVGIYGGAAFSTPVLGGWFAARWLGDRSAVKFGGMLIMAGHVGLAVQAGLTGEARTYALFAALATLVAGTGLLKPSIASMVGKLYPDGGPGRDMGFTIFSMCIWFGALLSGLVAGTLGERVGWDFGFGAAAVGMAIGLAAYLVLGSRLLGDIGMVPAPRRSATSANDRSASERARILVIVIFSAFTTLYAACFFLTGGLLSLVLEQQTDRRLGGFELPVTWFFSLSMAAFLIAAPTAALLWARLARRGRNPDVFAKQAIGLLVMALAYAVLWWATDVPSETISVVYVVGWFIAAYALFGIADAFIWPVQMSAIAAIAPARHASFLFGLWLFAGGIGIFLTGYLGSIALQYGNGFLFSGIAMTCVAAAAILIALRSRFRSILDLTT